MEDRARFSADMDLLQELQDVFDACNRNNTSIYALDPRGLSVGEFDVSTNISIQTSQRYLNSSMDALRTLAENTDGRAIVNRNDLGTAMKQIIRDASAYYLVGYTTQAPSDGKFHEIKVRVKRPGVQVRSRRGLLGLHGRRPEARRRRPQARPACRGDQGAGRDCAADQPALHPHLDRQRKGRRRSHEGDAAVGAAAADARA